MALFGVASTCSFVRASDGALLSLMNIPASEAPQQGVGVFSTRRLDAGPTVVLLDNQVVPDTFHGLLAGSIDYYTFISMCEAALHAQQSPPKSEPLRRRVCTKCGRSGHFARACKVPRAIQNHARKPATVEKKKRATPQPRPKKPRVPRKKPESAPSSSSSSSSSSAAATRECLICMDRGVDCFLEPCGHTQICMACAKKITTCPSCRKKITMFRRAFL